MAKSGNLSIHTENIFPIIKKFLYSDHEIFLRELVANAVDASQKLKMLASSGEFNGEIGDPTIKISIDKDKKTLTITDRGIGMSEEEVEKYINQIAFSSAEEFVEKYAETSEGTNIIGHFGLGFYSAFMVANRVELQTKSYRESDPAVKWECEGQTTFEISPSDKTDRGTEITLFINEDSIEFLEESRIEGILKKYCSFMPVEIEFNGTKINNTRPLWLKKPADITAEEYKEFYKELYPMSEEPLFWIHLNVDYPFNLTGILYFPKISNTFEVQKNKIHLYSNQVFITDEVKEIVPEFLTLLHGVIDSPDIPLNVSRSYLQSDANVKKISSYIVKKVAEKLGELFRDDRKAFEEKWEDIGFFIKYGMLTDDKFYDKAKDFVLLTDSDNAFYTLDEYREKTSAIQTDKSGQLVWLYTFNPEIQDSFVQSALKRGYNVLNFPLPIDTHFIQQLEQKLEKTAIRRVDSDTIDRLIDKDEKAESVLSADEQKELSDLYIKAVGDTKFVVKTEALSPDEAPVMITQSEWMRRFADMQRMNGMNMEGFGGNYDVIVNTNHPLAKKLSTISEDKKQAFAKHLFDLARLAQNMLSGKEMTEFVSRSIEYLEI